MIFCSCRLEFQLYRLKDRLQWVVQGTFTCRAGRARQRYNVMIFAAYFGIAPTQALCQGLCPDLVSARFAGGSLDGRLSRFQGP